MKIESLTSSIILAKHDLYNASLKIACHISELEQMMLEQPKITRCLLICLIANGKWKLFMWVLPFLLDYLLCRFINYSLLCYV